ncbi:MAG: hypothetical protein R2939_14180 [Kofleriaceae bacterium]
MSAARRWALDTTWRRRRWQVWTGLAVVLTLALTRLPLFGVLGYELALVAAVFASLAGLDLGAAIARDGGRLATDAGAGRVVLERYAAAAVATTTALVPPLVGGALGGLWRPTCDWGFGLVSFALLPIASGLVSAGAGVALGLLTAGRRRWLGNALPYVAWLALIAVGVARFYGEPPVFSYHPIVGFFPGNLYDEDIVLGAPLLWSRLEQALVVVATLAACAACLDLATRRLARPRLERRRALAIAVAAAALAGALRWHGGELGYAIDADDIAAALGGRLETEHFVIHYARTPEIEADLPLIAADHEFRLRQVSATLGVTPSTKITSFYFANSADKARWLGARRVEMAKPWRHEIYLDHEPFPHASLRHEIAHVVAAEFGDPVFGTSARSVLGLPLVFNPGMIEGLAVAVDWPGRYDQSLTPHQAVRAMQAQGGEPSVRQLLSLQFLAVASVRGYSTAGSFLRYLLDAHGAAALRRAYERGGDFEAAYGQPLATLERDWKEMLATVELPVDAAEGTRERYRRTAVFDRPCPHAIAARAAKVARLVGDGRLADAIRVQRDICRDAPREPRHQLELASLLAAAPGHADDAAAIWRALADDVTGVTSSLRAEAHARLADRAVAAGDLDGARAQVAAALALPLDDAQRRPLEAKAFALDHPGPSADALRAYLFATGSAPVDAAALAAAAVAAEPDLALAQYLHGLQLLVRRQWAEATAALARALDGALPSPRMEQFAARRLAVAAYRAGDAAGLDRAIAALRAPGRSLVDGLYADDWIARRADDAAR